jgi:hypothetical protein
MQLSRVRSQHPPPTQWNLRGGQMKTKIKMLYIVHKKEKNRNKSPPLKEYEIVGKQRHGENHLYLSRGKTVLLKSAICPQCRYHWKYSSIPLRTLTSTTSTTKQLRKQARQSQIQRIRMHKMCMSICPLSKCNYFFTLRLVINVPVRHVDLHQFEDGYCLLLQGLVSHKCERFAAKKQSYKTKN